MDALCLYTIAGLHTILLPSPIVHVTACHGVVWWDYNMNTLSEGVNERKSKKHLHYVSMQEQRGADMRGAEVNFWQHGEQWDAEIHRAISESTEDGEQWTTQCLVMPGPNSLPPAIYNCLSLQMHGI